LFIFLFFLAHDDIVARAMSAISIGQTLSEIESGNQPSRKRLNTPPPPQMSFYTMNNINSIYIYLTPPKKGGVKPIKPYD
jgi:hypothetical protein